MKNTLNYEDIPELKWDTLPDPPAKCLGISILFLYVLAALWIIWNIITEWFSGADYSLVPQKIGNIINTTLEILILIGCVCFIVSIVAHSFFLLRFDYTHNDMAHLRRGFRAHNMDISQNLRQATNSEFCTAPPPSSGANC